MENLLSVRNVVEKGTTNGTVTDLDGKFTIEVSETVSFKSLTSDMP